MAKTDGDAPSDLEDPEGYLNDLEEDAMIYSGIRQ
jgi:hypothetical protein